VSSYIVWRQVHGDDPYHAIGTEQGHNAWNAVENLIATMRVDVGDRVFLVGRISAEEPYGGVHYEIEATGARPKVLA
jgi:hypothetical protein